jgi:hypothetical protein
VSRVPKFLMFVLPVLLILSCNLVTQPISDVQNLAGTAEAMATQGGGPLETAMATPSEMPGFMSTMIPGGVPDVSQYLNPSGKPAADWNGLPIMPQATAGQEFSSNTYSFEVDATAADVQSFYDDKLKALGWTQPFSLGIGSEGGEMLFTKDNNILSVTITPSDNGVVVVLELQ